MEYKEEVFHDTYLVLVDASEYCITSRLSLTFKLNRTANRITVVPSQ